MIKLLFLCFLAAITADYVTLGTNQYPINSNKCPLGYVCGYANNQSQIALTLIKNFQSNLSANATFVTISSLRGVYSNLTNLYSHNTISASNTLMVPYSLLLLLFGIFIDKKYFLLALLASVALVRAGEGSSGGHGGEGEGGGREGEGEGGRTSEHEGNGEGARSNGDDYSYNGFVVSSIDPVSGLYPISLRLHGAKAAISINQNACLVLNTTESIALYAQECLTILNSYQNCTEMMSLPNCTNYLFQLTNITAQIKTICIESSAQTLQIETLAVALIIALSML